MNSLRRWLERTPDLYKSTSKRLRGNQLNRTNQQAAVSEIHGFIMTYILKAVSSNGHLLEWSNFWVSLNIKRSVFSSQLLNTICVTFSFWLFTKTETLKRNYTAEMLQEAKTIEGSVRYVYNFCDRQTDGNGARGSRYQPDNSTTVA